MWIPSKFENEVKKVITNCKHFKNDNYNLIVYSLELNEGNVEKHIEMITAILNSNIL